MAEDRGSAEWFRERYVVGDAPWDTGAPNPELLRVVESGGLPGPTLLELGCGTGTNAVELARRGYKVTAVDQVALAVERGREKARQAGVHVDFHVEDVTRFASPRPFDAVFDLGLYHGVRRSDLAGLLRTLDRVTRPGTRWLSIAGNAREPHEEGPPVVGEPEFRSELGSRFTFVDVREFRLGLKDRGSPLMGSILMERRP